MSDIDTIEDRKPISQDKLYKAIIDCQDLCTNLVLVPYERMLDEDREWMAPDDEVVMNTPEPKTRKEKIHAFFHPPRTQIIRKIGTAKYPPHLYYFSTSYSYKVMPFTHTTAQINEGRSRLEVYYQKLAKSDGFMKYILPMGAFVVMCAVAVAVVYIIVGSGGS